MEFDAADGWMNLLEESEYLATAAWPSSLGSEEGLFGRR